MLVDGMANVFYFAETEVAFLWLQRDVEFSHALKNGLDTLNELLIVFAMNDYVIQVYFASDVQETCQNYRGDDPLEVTG